MATGLLLLVNSSIFLAVLLGNNDAFPFFAAKTLPGLAAGEWWRLITAGYLHIYPIHIIMNMYWEPIQFELPKIENSVLYRVVDTALDAPHDILEPGQEQPHIGAGYLAQGRSVVVLITKIESTPEKVSKRNSEKSVK